jgi:hypothetical protein
MLRLDNNHHCTIFVWEAAKCPGFWTGTCVLRMSEEKNVSWKSKMFFLS